MSVIVLSVLLVCLINVCCLVVARARFAETTSYRSSSFVRCRFVLLE